MTYFHRCTSTIIGAKAFHCPVRDGKEWDQLAMVIRLKLFTAPGLSARHSSFAESISILDCVPTEGGCNSVVLRSFPSVHVFTVLFDACGIPASIQIIKVIGSSLTGN